jgi:hypothetical protein
MSCNCIKDVQDLIRERYQDPEATINVGFAFGGNTLDVKPSGMGFTYRPKKKDGTYSTKQKEGGLSPSYCPFCGKKYETAAPEAPSAEASHA